MKERIDDNSSNRNLRLEALYKEAPVAIGFSRDGITVGANPAYVKLFGYDSEQELIGRSLLDQIAPRAREQIVRNIEARRSGEPIPSRYETIGLRKDGSEFPFRCDVKRVEIADEPLTMVFVEDVTEPKRVDEALRLSEERFREVVAAAPMAILVWDLDSRVVDWNLQAERTFGWTREEVLGRDFFEFMIPESVRPRVREVTGALLRGQTPGPTTNENVTRSGATILCEWNNAILRDDSGTVVGIVSLAVDVTERNRAQHEVLRLSRLQELLTEISTTFINLPSSKLEAQIDLALGRIGSFFGVDRVYLFDYRFHEGICVNTHEWCADGVEPQIELLKAVQLEGIPEFVSPHVSGNTLYIPDVQALAPGSLREILLAQGILSALTVPLMDRAECIGFVGFDSVTRIRAFAEPEQQLLKLFAQLLVNVRNRKRDDEQRERLEEQLHHAQKMEAIGTLAGGVAHDFNNILAGLMGGLSMLERQLPASRSGLHDDVKEMQALVNRGADLARQLLGIGRKGRYDVRPLDLGAVVQKTSTLFGRTRPDVTIKADLDPELLRVLMDHTQLEQVLLNLFVNAGQAMAGGGQLLVRAENAELDEQECSIHGMKPGNFVKLVVADTGSGMDQATMSRIFEPFFTTKGPGSGSGLGLASVYGIVKNHGGMISVQSEQGKGSAFTIFLPATTEPEPRPSESPAAVRSGVGTILVVDDEDMLLRMCTRQLNALGYETLTASRGERAVELLREHGDGIALVILDLTMPGMSGAKTFDALRQIAPGLKVLLASGYSADGQAQELLSRGCNGFIQKPFDMNTLAEKVQSVLWGLPG